MLQLPFIIPSPISITAAIAIAVKTAFDKAAIKTAKTNPARVVIHQRIVQYIPVLIVVLGIVRILNVLPPVFCFF